MTIPLERSRALTLQHLTSKFYQMFKGKEYQFCFNSSKEYKCGALLKFIYEISITSYQSWIKTTLK